MRASASLIAAVVSVVRPVRGSTAKSAPMPMPEPGPPERAGEKPPTGRSGESDRSLCLWWGLATPPSRSRSRSRPVLLRDGGEAEGRMETVPKRFADGVPLPCLRI